MKLNPQQQQAVEYVSGPCLVLAGAGSGKTRVIINKIAHLIEHCGYLPKQIAAVTFTNKAAREMKERVAHSIGKEKSKGLIVSTFHTLGFDIIKREYKALGFKSNMTLFDEHDQLALLKELTADVLQEDKDLLRELISVISNWKNDLVSPKQAYALAKDAKYQTFAKCYERYAAQIRAYNALDFDDLIMLPTLLFKQNDEVRSKWQEKIRYLLVDEYQDTNYAQHSIVLQLAKDHQHVCVVGDDAQSIYSFRGADIDNILYFTKVYPNTKVFKLEQNYRSTQTIVCAANSLIEKNERQIRKEVFSEKEKGEAIGVFQAYSDVEEGDIVVNKIAELRRSENYAYSDFAILYRTNAQSRVFEEAMRKRGMPYRIYGGLSFYQRKEIKDVIAYFRLVVNPNDEEAFKRIINYPARGIGDTTVGKIITAATENNISLWAVLCEPLTYGLNFNKGTHSKLQIFRDLIGGFIEGTVEKNAYEIGTEIIRQSGIINDVCQDNSPENLSRKENIEELVNGMSDFCALRMEEGNLNISLTDFLSEVSLLTDQDSDNGDDEKITLMTVHSAKGLEFRNVFVVGMEENLFPSSMVGDSPRALEEERRLFYVAITRAEEHCFLSYARTRFRYGKMEFGSPSRFLKDIDIRFLRLPQDAGIGSKIDEEAGSFRREHSGGFSRSPHVRESLYNTEKETPQRSKQQIIAPSVPRNLKRVTPATSSSTPTSASVMAVQPGQLIEHERFGLGEVMKVEGQGDNAKATIHFKNAGDKQLLLRFARFKIIG